MKAFMPIKRKPASLPVNSELLGFTDSIRICSLLYNCYQLQRREQIDNRLSIFWL